MSNHHGMVDTLFSCKSSLPEAPAPLTQAERNKIFLNADIFRRQVDQ